MRIAVDAMGGDLAPDATVDGINQAARELSDIHFILTGDESRIKKVLDQKRISLASNIDIFHTPEVIQTDEEPVRAVRKKKDSSLVQAVHMVKEGQADAVISAGNTGAFMTAGLLHLGRIKGIDRPGLAPIIPTIDGKGTLVLDVGANMETRPQHLVQYAIMGSIYAQKVMGVEKPRVGLLNVGVEEKKGNDLSKQAFARLQSAPIHFVGNVEARDLPYGVCDVMVCDGFTGNILLKTMEGTANSIFDVLKQEFTRNTISKLAAAVLKPGLKRMKKKMDYAEHGGAPLMGLRHICIKAHGSSDARAIKNAVYQTKKFFEQQVIQQISTEIKEVSDDDEN
ncbi:MAG: phosphate acyltransferase PlsX [Bacillaceae bacterium]|nr:phosphate acyltransferase PlsX [Bacillaceae bacterium]